MSTGSAATRRFDRLDAAILAMATLAGLGLRWATAHDVALDLHLRGDRPSILRASKVASPLLTAWAPALLVLSLRRPRPPWRKLTRQPGVVACGIGIVVLLVQLSGIMLRWALAWLWPEIGSLTPPQRVLPPMNLWPHGVFPLPPSPRSPLRELWLSLSWGLHESAYSAHGIAGAWLIMALGGWWKPQRTWIDRLGRALGTAWIAMMVAWLVVGFI
jgi:hypothetical protein